MSKYICTKSNSSNFACPCEKCAKDFVENIEKIWGVSTKYEHKCVELSKRNYKPINASKDDLFCLYCGQPYYEN